MMSVRVRDVSIPVSKVDLRPDPAGITRVSNLDPTTTVTCCSLLFYCLNVHAPGLKALTKCLFKILLF